MKYSELQKRAIKLLKELGADKNSLWLVEVQSIEQAKKFYDPAHIEDLVKFKDEEEDSIIYYHESGSIHQHSTFNTGDKESFKKAVKWIAKYLGADIKEVS